MKRTGKNGTMITLKRILKYAKPYVPYLILTSVCSALSVLLSLYFFILVGKGVDCIVGKGHVDFQGLYRILVELAVMAVGTFFAEWGMNVCSNKLTFSVVKDLRQDALRKIETVPLKFIDDHRHGDLMSRLINDVEQISDGLLMGFKQLFSGITTILATLAFMFAYNYKIALVVVLVTPVSLFAAAFIAKRTYTYFKKQSELRGEMTSFTEEMIGGQKIVAAFGRENANREEFEKINERYRESSLKAVFLSSTVNPSTRFVNGLVYASVAVAGTLEVIATAGTALPFTVGKLSAFLTYANKYTKPFNEISSVVTELQSAFASAKRVFEIIDSEPQTPDIPNAHVFEDVCGDVKLDGVDFSYNKDVELIKNLNLDVKAGQRIALVGPTGCGKTTVINLLMRFYDTDAGTISVDGVPIRDATRDSLRLSYGMVLQETWLKKGTVAENIAYGRKNAAMEDVVRAAKHAHAHGFIMKLPNGYDTVISDDTDHISAGQKQLLCIARVLLDLPPMLILDEATSSIDTRTELKIQSAFAEMMQGRTSFIVAHRLSTIKEADCILVMKDGHIIEQGKHEELLGKGGFYANLYHAQFEIA